MVLTRHQLRRISSFLTIGGEELAAAQVLLANGLSRQAVFQAQQSVEKHLRALIEAENKRAGVTHSIRDLALILGAEHKLHAAFLSLDDLSTAATRHRYPAGSGGLSDLPTDDELSQVLLAIETLRTDVIRFLDARQLLSKG